MKKDELLILVCAALSVLFMFLPSLVFNAACLFGFCEYVSGEYVILAQIIQVCWLACCLFFEFTSNQYSLLKSRSG